MVIVSCLTFKRNPIIISIHQNTIIPSLSFSVCLDLSLSITQFLLLSITFISSFFSHPFSVSLFLSSLSIYSISIISLCLSFCLYHSGPFSLSAPLSLSLSAPSHPPPLPHTHTLSLSYLFFFSFNICIFVPQDCE